MKGGSPGSGSGLGFEDLRRWGCGSVKRDYESGLVCGGDSEFSYRFHEFEVPVGLRNI